MKKRTKRLLFLGLLAGAIFACQPKDVGKNEEKLVVATTTMVADLVRVVGGEDVQLEGLMAPQVDPHLYRASPSEIALLNRAQAIFYSGLLLEGRMQEVLERVEKAGKAVFAVTAGIPKASLIAPAHSEGHPDPHVWGDVRLWMSALDEVERGLSKTFPQAAESFKARASAYRSTLSTLHEWALARVATIPEGKRKLITSHDAFGYFGRAYGLEVVGVQGISTASDPSMADRTKMVDFIKDRGIQAIFVETSVSPVLIEQIAKDAGVTVGGTLFSDAMGTPGEMESEAGETYDKGTYPGMIKHNINTIVKALQ